MTEAFPVQRESGGGTLFVPWLIGAQAWGVYAQTYGTMQSASVIAARGGFGETEMNEYRPGWREHIIGGVQSAAGAARG